MDSDDYVGQCLLETAAYLSISAGRRVSVAMMVNRLREEIKSDVSYKKMMVQLILPNLRANNWCIITIDTT